MVLFYEESTFWGLDPSTAHSSGGGHAGYLPCREISVSLSQEVDHLKHIIPEGASAYPDVVEMEEGRMDAA